MPIGEKQRPEAVVSVTAEDPEPPKKKKDKAEENLAQARKELKDNTELVRNPGAPLARRSARDELA